MPPITIALSRALHTALAAAVPLSEYPKAALVVHVTVLQDDGSLLPACVAAATVALARARVTLCDVVTAGSVAVVVNDGTDANDSTVTTCWADPTHHEESQQAAVVVTVAMLPSTKHVTLWEQHSSIHTTTSGTAALSPAVTNQAMELCRDGCRTLQRFIAEHLRSEWLQEEEKEEAS